MAVRVGVLLQMGVVGGQVSAVTPELSGFFAVGGGNTQAVGDLIPLPLSLRRKPDPHP